MLEIQINDNQEKLTLSLKGRLVMNSVTELENKIRDLDGEVETLILEMKELSYLSSSGLRVLLAAQKKMDARGGRLIVRNVNELIMEIFDATGFTDILTIENGA